MKAVCQVLNDDGTQAMDSVTGEPHAFDFPIAPEAYAVIEAWMAGQGTTDAEGVVVPKWRNMGQLAAQLLRAGGGGFKSMAPADATADLDQIVEDAQAERESRFAAMFGVVV